MKVEEEQDDVPPSKLKTPMPEKDAASPAQTKGGDIIDDAEVDAGAQKVEGKDAAPRSKPKGEEDDTSGGAEFAVNAREEEGGWGWGEGGWGRTKDNFEEKEKGQDQEAIAEELKDKEQEVKQSVEGVNSEEKEKKKELSIDPDDLAMILPKDYIGK